MLYPTELRAQLILSLPSPLPLKPVSPRKDKSPLVPEIIRGDRTDAVGQGCPSPFSEFLLSPVIARPREEGVQIDKTKGRFFARINYSTNKQQKVYLTTHEKQSARWHKALAPLVSDDPETAPDNHKEADYITDKWTTYLRLATQNNHRSDVPQRRFIQGPPVGLGEIALVANEGYLLDRNVELFALADNFGQRSGTYMASAQMSLWADG